MNSLISVIIPSTGNKITLKRLLDSILIQQLSPQVVVVVNNTTIERFKELKSSLKYSFEILWSYSEKKGVNIARNKGIALASSEIILFLDDDCSLRGPLFLNQHLLVHAKKNEVFALGGGYTLLEPSRFWDRVYNYLQMKWFVIGARELNARSLLGGNFSVKARLLREFGLSFDESIIYGGSEYEFFVKANRLGLVMEANMPDVVHHTSESLKSIVRKHYLQGRGSALISKKYPDHKSQGANSITDPLQSVLFNFSLVMLNYVFWFGHDVAQGRGVKVVLRMMGDGYRALNFKRYQILNKISKKMSR